MGANVTRVQITDRDHGYRARLAAIRKIGQHILSVGIQGSRAGERHRGSARGLSGFAGIVKTAKSLSVGEIAAIHEFGLGGLPQRAWLRGWVDGNASLIRNTLRNIALRVVGGKLDEVSGLSLAGVKFQGGIQRGIRAGVPPPNAPSTIRRKGSSTPLVDTGQLRASVTWVVISREVGFNVLR